MAGWLQQMGQETPTHTPVRVCLEATGTYGDTIARALHHAGHTVSLVNPAAVRAFAKSQLKRT